MLEKYLPIGTVVELNGSDRKVMIISYLIYSRDNSAERVLYDYGGCLFPEGVIDSNQTLGFNHEQIKKVVYLGLNDEDSKKLNELLVQKSDEVHQKFDEGSTDFS